MRDPFDDVEDRDWDANENDEDGTEAEDVHSWEPPEEPEEDSLTFGGMPLPLLWDLTHDGWPGDG